MSHKKWRPLNHLVSWGRSPLSAPRKSSMDTARRTASALGIDFGTHHTVATVLRGDGRRHQLLFEGNPLMPSGIYLDYEASILVGRDAAREGRRHPERYERNPKLQIGSPNILLGDKEIPSREAVAAVLKRVLSECGRVAGTPQQVTVTVPAGWGPAKRHVVGDAAATAGAAELQLLPEPVAAARYFVEVLDHGLEVGQAVVVFDLGAGTFDASVVSRNESGYEVLAVDGSDRIGGHYLDQALVDYIGRRYENSEESAERWRSLLNPNAGIEEQRLRFALYDEVREAKELLSRRVSVDIAVPGFAANELLNRSELELLARPLLTEAVTITKAVIREAGLDSRRLAGIFMVGGASRMPLAATMLHQELGIAPTLIEEPELVVSEGAAVVPAEPTRPMAVAPFASPAHPSPAASPAQLLAPVAPQVLPPAPVPRKSRRGPLLVTGVVAIVAAIVGGGASLIYANANQSASTGIFSSIDKTPSAEPSPESLEEGVKGEDAENETPELEVEPEWSAVAIVDVEATADSITFFTDADAAFTNCSVEIHGLGTYSDLDCGEVRLSGLYASTDYTIELHGPAAADEPIVTHESTDTVSGEVYWNCPMDRAYCAEQNGEIRVGTDPERTEELGRSGPGDRWDLVCYTPSGEEITPRGEEADGEWDYHPGKETSNIAVRVDYGGETGYIPFVWLIVESTDLNSTGAVPPC